MNAAVERGLAAAKFSLFRRTLRRQRAEAVRSGMGILASARAAFGRPRGGPLASLVAALALLASTALAQTLTAAEAVRALGSADVQQRHAAVARLAEVGVMADVTPLLASLRDADADVRQEAEQAIWRIWSRSGDDAIDALYRQGMEQMSSGDVEHAIATFTSIIERKPAFAEGWNKRATLYFMVGDYRRSLADCDEVIKRNPNHFGALSGYAQIYAHLGSYERALEYARRALAIDPNLDGMRQAIDVLEQLVEQKRRHTV
jgi:tetratricopeptide (TPR) repeat protein